MFSWLRDFRGKQRIEDLQVKVEELATNLDRECSYSDALCSEHSEVLGRHDCMKALLEEKVFPALEELERQGACADRLRLGFAAELTEMFVRAEDDGVDPGGWL